MGKSDWSNLVNSDMGHYVASCMDNSDLKYHNFKHIERLYEKALEWELSYDCNLDCAILWHDSVYDAQPDKEIRSAELMEKISKENPQWFEGIDIQIVKEMILATVTHTLPPTTAGIMIKLDLADLAEPARARENFWSLLQESINLYKISPAKAAQGTLDFMSKFAIIVEHNRTAGHWDRDFIGDGDQYWDDVSKGIKMNQHMADTVVQLYERGYV